MANNGSIIRVRHDRNNPYVTINRNLFEDRRLSWEARGLLGYLLAKPDDWQVRFYDLVNQSAAGAYKVRRILKELQKHGYLMRDRIKTETGQFEWVSSVYEVPIETEVEDIT